MHWTADELYKYVKTLELGSSSVTPGPSPSGDKYFVHDQSFPSNEWEITHNLGKHPAVTVIDSVGNEVEGDCNYIDDNSLTLTFAFPFSGMAFLN